MDEALDFSAISLANTNMLERAGRQKMSIAVLFTRAQLSCANTEIRILIGLTRSHPCSLGTGQLAALDSLTIHCLWRDARVLNLPIRLRPYAIEDTLAGIDLEPVVDCHASICSKGTSIETHCDCCHHGRYTLFSKAQSH